MLLTILDSLVTKLLIDQKPDCSSAYLLTVWVEPESTTNNWTDSEYSHTTSFRHLDSAA